MTDPFTFVTSIEGHLAYAAIFGMLLLCGLGLPVPEDMTLLAAGYLSHQQVVHFVPAVLVSMVAVLGGDSMIYGFGRWLGPNVYNSRIGKLVLTKRRRARVEKVLNRYGDRVVFMARFMPGLRAPVYLLVGSFRMAYWRFLALDAVAALVSVPLWVFLGQYFGQQIDQVIKWVKHTETTMGLVLLLVIGIVAYILVRRHRLNKLARAQQKNLNTVPSQITHRDNGMKERMPADERAEERVEKMG